jgi:hypothetical protein
LGVGVNGYPGHVIFSTFSLLLFFSAAFARFFFKRTRNLFVNFCFENHSGRTNRICIEEKREDAAIDRFAATRPGRLGFGQPQFHIHR